LKKKQSAGVLFHGWCIGAEQERFALMGSVFGSKRSGPGRGGRKGNE